MIEGLCFLSVFSLALSLPLAAQITRVTGQIVNADAVPVAGVRVVLHRVGRELQGPIDSTRAGPKGRFSFTFRPDTSAFYLVSGRYAGIEYFSSPLPTRPARSDSIIRIVVYDTSSNVPITLEARHLVLTSPAEDGSRSVLDLIVLRNPARVTLVAPDSSRGSWGTALPQGTSGLQVSESDVSAEAIRRTGDSLVVSAALAPGEKQLTIQYQVPREREVIELPLQSPGLRLNVLTEETAVGVVGPGIALADTQVIQGRSFRRWTGTVARAGVLRLLLPRAGGTPRWLLPALVGALGLGLLAAGWYALAGNRSRTGARSAQLLEAIATLDARYVGRQGETSPGEWSSYQAERTRLKHELEASLAAEGWRP